MAATRDAGASVTLLDLEMIKLREDVTNVGRVGVVISLVRDWYWWVWT